MPGQDRRYLLALQSGEFYLFDVDEEGSAGEPREVASIRVSRRHNEEGFLSFALHPQYPQDPRLVVHYSVHDERRGGAVQRYRGLKEGETDTADEIIAYCRENLAKFKVPRLVAFRSELTKPMVGKILRRMLVEEERKKQAQ